MVIRRRVLEPDEVGLVENRERAADVLAMAALQSERIVAGVLRSVVRWTAAVCANSSQR